jgi:hypothetical protein
VARRLNPVGNARLTALVGLLILLGPVAVELATIVLGVHSHMSLHVFVGLALIPAVVLKLASTGWRFARYYTRSQAYVEHGAPRVTMRLLAPLFVAATVVLFSSGNAMGVLQGHGLVVARRLHGPASVLWSVLFGVHALVYLKRALVDGSREVTADEPPVAGRRRRGYAIAVVVALGLAVGAATVPAQHRWVRLPRDHQTFRQRAACYRCKGASPARHRNVGEPSLAVERSIPVDRSARVIGRARVSRPCRSRSGSVRSGHGSCGSATSSSSRS